MASSTPPSQHGELKYLTSLPPAPLDEMLALQKERETDQAQQMKRRLEDNPLVPIGCLSTAAILTYGLFAMKQGNHYRSQMMMRARVAAQGITVAFLLGGTLWATLSTKKK